jgi:hypothetical protein
MILYEKILQLRPNLSENDFDPDIGTIVLQNDLDEKGDYIKEWNHATETQPTQQELDSIE